MNQRQLKTIRKYCRENSYNERQAIREYEKLDLHERTNLMKEMRYWLQVNEQQHGTTDSNTGKKENKKTDSNGSTSDNK